jgi:hypothetical protein
MRKDHPRRLRKGAVAIAAVSAIVVTGSVLTAGRSLAIDSGSLAQLQPSLGYVQTRNTGSGTVEVHIDAATGLQTGGQPLTSSYVRRLDAASDFGTGAAGNGTFSLSGNVGGFPELGFAQTQNSGSGTVEVHIDAFNGRSYVRVLDATSDFAPANRSLGTFSLFGSVNGEPELGFVKTSGTPSGNVEIHIDTWNGHSYSRALDAVTSVPEYYLAEGTIEFLTGPNTVSNGQPDIAYTQNANGSSVLYLAFGPGGYTPSGGEQVGDGNRNSGQTSVWQPFPDPTFNGTGTVPPPVLANVTWSSITVHVIDYASLTDIVTNGMTYSPVLDVASTFSKAAAQNGSFFVLPASS